MNIFSELSAGQMVMLFLAVSAIPIPVLWHLYQYQACGKKLFECREEINTMLKGTSFYLRIISSHSWYRTDYSGDRYGIFTAYDQYEKLEYGLSTVEFLKCIRKVKAGKMTLPQLRERCRASALAHNKLEAERNSL